MKLEVVVTSEKPDSEWRRPDENLVVPMDGGTYVQLKTDVQVLGHPRQYDKESGAIDTYAYPAVVYADWGWETKFDYANYEERGGIVDWDIAARHMDRVYDYVQLKSRWQWFFWEFLDEMSGRRLPRGRIEYFYTNPKNSGLFAYTTPGSLSDVYRSLIEKSRSHSDSYPPESGGTDYVLQRNIALDRPYEFLCRPTTGYVAKVKRVLGTKVELYAIDLLQPCPDPHNLPPHLYFWATQVNINGSVTRYPQIKEAFKVHGWGPTGTPMPMFSVGGTVKVDKSAVEFLSPGQPWSPYKP